MARPFPKRSTTRGPSDFRLDRAQKFAQIFALVAVPLVVAVIGWQYQRKAADDATRQRYVELAIGVLREKRSGETATLRRWAAQTLARYSTERFTGEELRALENGTVVLPKPTFDSGRITADSPIAWADGDGSIIVDGNGDQIIFSARTISKKPALAKPADAKATPIHARPRE
jgi:hypothetical protein